MKEKLRAVWMAVYGRIEDGRAKNVLLFILAAMTLFGIVAPEEATSIRDAILAMAL